MNKYPNSLPNFFGLTKLFNESPLNITGFTWNFKTNKNHIHLHPLSICWKQTAKLFSTLFEDLKIKVFGNWNQFEYVTDKKISDEKYNNWSELNWIPSFSLGDFLWFDFSMDMFYVYFSSINNLPVVLYISLYPCI